MLDTGFFTGYKMSVFMASGTWLCKAVCARMMAEPNCWWTGLILGLNYDRLRTGLGPRLGNTDRPFGLPDREGRQSARTDHFSCIIRPLQFCSS